jgi:hydrogenase maturation protease
VTTVLVLGLGNPLIEDDGVGLQLLERVRSERDWPDDDVEFVDGGTWGLSLLPAITDAERLLLLDAVRSGAPPGTVRCARDDAVPRLYRRPASPHQVDVGEVLAAAELLGRLPASLAVVGIEPARTDRLHVGLSPAVAASLGPATAEACRLLANWCPVARPRG